MSETKQCPYCGEEILAAAKKCKHCNHWLNQEQTVPQSEIPTVPPTPTGVPDSQMMNHPQAPIAQSYTMGSSNHNLLVINICLAFVGLIVALGSAYFEYPPMLQRWIPFAVYTVGALLFWLGTIRLLTGSSKKESIRCNLVTAISLLICLIVFIGSNLILDYHIHFDWNFLCDYHNYIGIYSMWVMPAALGLGFAAVINYFFLTKTTKNK